MARENTPNKPHNDRLLRESRVALGCVGAVER